MVEVIQFDEDHFSGDGFFISVSREEAMRIIETLAKQITNNDGNTNRAEFGKRIGRDATYFTISVREEPDTHRYNLGDIWAAEDAIEASDTETGL